MKNKLKSGNFKSNLGLYIRPKWTKDFMHSDEPF